MKSFQVRIPDALYEALKAKAEREETTIADQLRQALKAWTITEQSHRHVA